VLSGALRMGLQQGPRTQGAETRADGLVDVQQPIALVPGALVGPQAQLWRHLRRPQALLLPGATLRCNRPGAPLQQPLVLLVTGWASHSQSTIASLRGRTRCGPFMYSEPYREAQPGPPCALALNLKQSDAASCSTAATAAHRQSMHELQAILLSQPGAGKRRPHLQPQDDGHVSTRALLSFVVSVEHAAPLGCVHRQEAGVRHIG